jgi:two-component system, NtrC family, nitrogen regulation response regulator NtrX
VATHRNLEAWVREGKFRQDLFHRIYVFPVLLPLLRERKEDIPVLVQHFAEQVCAQNNWKPIPFTPEAIQQLKEHAWPGNVRELRNVVERLILLATGAEVTIETVEMALPQALTAQSALSGSGTLSERAQGFEREVILAELKRHQFHVTNAAKALGLERSHLYKKAEQLGIDLRSLRHEPGDGGSTA